MSKDNKILVLICVIFLSTPIVTLIMSSVFKLRIFNSVVPLARDVLVIFLLIGISFLNSYKQLKFKKKIFYFLLISLCYILQGFLFSDSSILGVMINIRRIFMPVMLLIIGYHLNFSIKFFFQVLKVVVILLFVFGLLEIILDKTIWLNFFNLPFYWSNITQEDYSYSYNDSARLYTPDLNFFTDIKFRRMISFFLEPSTLGTFYANAFALFYQNRNIKKSLFFSFICFLGGVLCFSKIFLITLLSLILFKFFIKRFAYLIVPVSLVFAIGCGFYIYSFLGLVHGSFSHVIGVYTGFNVIIDNPLGLGLGLGGNRPGLELNGIMNGLWGGESGLGNVIIQSSIIGFIFIYLFHKTFISYRKFNSEFKIQILYLTFALWINFLFSASSLGISGNFMFLLLLGLIFKQYHYDKKSIF
jgi:hypothetical protein